MAHTHDIETISKKIAYRKHIKDLGFETRDSQELERSEERRDVIRKN